MAEPVRLVTELVHSEIASARRTLEAFAEEPGAANAVSRMITLVAGAFRSGGKVLACGNGGSAADAMHLCEELTGRFRGDRSALPAIACVDPGHLTCAANDFGYDAVFSRWVEALGASGDVLIVLSTSGNSGNIIRAVEAARSRGLRTIALLGKGGGKLRGACDVELVVPGTGGTQHADRIQEVHMMVLHILVCGVERELGYAKS